MSDELQKKIFSENLNRLLQDRDKTQSEVAKEIDVSPQTFNTWTQGIAIPRMGLEPTQKRSSVAKTLYFFNSWSISWSPWSYFYPVLCEISLLPQCYYLFLLEGISQDRTLHPLQHSQIHRLSFF